MGKELIQPARQIGLTSPANSPKLRGGDIFMADQGETLPVPVGENLTARKRNLGPTPRETLEHLTRVAWERDSGGLQRPTREASLGADQDESQGSGTKRNSGGYVDRQDLYMDAVKSLAGELRPEFRVAIGSAETPDEAYGEIFAQYTGLINDIGRRVGEAAGVLGDEGASLRESLRVEEAKLRADFKKTMEALGQAAPDRSLTNEERAAVTAIDSMPEGNAKRDAIRTYIQTYFQEKSAADNPLPNEILRLIAKDEATTEKFVSELIVMELENEQWQIKGFFGNINLEKFLKVIRNEWNTSPVDIARRDRLTTLIDANRGFHDMNYILRRNFDQFAQQSEVIQPEHLRVLSQISGVAEGISLYEELYTAERAREGYITEEAAKGIDLEVENALGRLANARRGDGVPLIKGVMGGHMEKWEVYRAHVYARDTFRILMRAVEQTALSDLPPGNKQWTTVALGKVAMIFETLKFNGLRFMPAVTSGGPELLDRMLENMKEKRRGTWEKGGKVKVRLSRVGGTDVGLMELQTIVAARGVLATWRAGEAVLAETRFTDNGEITDVTTFFAAHKEQIERLMERQRHNEDPATIKRDAAELFAPLLKGTSINLGLMASSFGIAPLESFRELVWEKVATQDPLVMAQLLTGAQVDSEVAGDLAGLQSLQDILIGVWGTDEQKSALIRVRALKAEIATLEGKQARKMTDADRLRLDTTKQDLGKKTEIVKQALTSERWKTLTEKLRTAHRMRMSDEVARITRQDGETEQQFIERLSRVPKKLAEFLTGEQALIPEEQQVLNEIMTNGQRIAPDLARIKRAYAWFLDDVPFQSINWEKLGQFYDREVNDLAGFNKGAQALIQIVNNPFGVPSEKTLETFGEAVVAVNAILREDVSQDDIQPMFETYLQMINKTGNRQLIWTELMHQFNQPTSRAQEIIGVTAPSVDEAGMRTILEESVPRHITRKGGWDRKTGAFKWANTQQELVKHFGATAWRVFGWKNLRDYGPIGLVAILIEFFKGTFTYKSQS